MQLGLEESIIFYLSSLFSLLVACCPINKNLLFLSFSLFPTRALPKCMFCHCVHAWRADQSWRTTGSDALRGAVFKRPEFIMTRSHWLYKVISTWMKSLEPPLSPSLPTYCLLPPISFSLQLPIKSIISYTNQRTRWLWKKNEHMIEKKGLVQKSQQQQQKAHTNSTSGCNGPKRWIFSSQKGFLVSFPSSWSFD